MKALKINSELQTIEEVEVNSYTDLYSLIGNGCTCFTAPVSFENGDTIYCDDEGLYHDFQGGFMMEDWDYPIVGNAVLQGVDDEGDSIEPITTKEELEKMIVWQSKETCDEWAGNFF